MKNKRSLVVIGLIVPILIGVSVWVLFFSEWPGGMRSTYKAGDFDPRLTQEARTATDIIKALDRFHRDHSCFPVNSVELAPYLPAVALAPNTPAIAGWSYDRIENGAGYTLWRALGWDPTLTYVCDNLHGSWVFNPGDGSPEKPIQLRL